MTSQPQQPSGIDAYRVGREFQVMPIPMVPSACIEVPAGPITFVVESRRLTDEAINTNALAQGHADGVVDDLGVDDGGASLHVLGAEDRLEHLRFDCFDHEPHYHYIRQSEQTNVVVAIDTHAEGDPAQWALACTRDRLPEMLEFCGVSTLADQVRRHRDQVDAALPEVERLVVSAGKLAARPTPR